MSNTSNDIDAKLIKRLLLGVYKKYSAGSISEGKAQKEAYLLNLILRAVEVTDLEERLIAIQQNLKDE